jgi:hypothetical protein
MGYADYVNQHGFSPRARRVLNDLLGSDCNGLKPERLAIRLSEFSERDVLRIQKVGRVTTKQIELFLKQHGCHFTRVMS